MRSGHGIGLTAAIVLALGGMASAQAQQSGTIHYEQHNLGPTGCDIVVMAANGRGGQRSVHFDEGQRQAVSGVPMICRDGKLLPVDQPPASH